MLKPIVQSADGVTLIGGGDAPSPLIAEALAYAPILAAADSGAVTALAHGHAPVAVIGDMDSLDALAGHGIDPATIHRIAEQDTTDFDKALRSIAARFVIGVGFTGRRLDHHLAAFNVLVRHADRRCLLLTEHDVCFHLPPRFEIALAPGTRVSLFPMRPCRGESSGLRWPIDGIGFAPDARIGTSNAADASGRVALEMEGPGMLAILPRRALAAAIGALAGG